MKKVTCSVCSGRGYTITNYRIGSQEICQCCKGKGKVYQYHLSSKEKVKELLEQQEAHDDSK